MIKSKILREMFVPFGMLSFIVEMEIIEIKTLSQITYHMDGKNKYSIRVEYPDGREGYDVPLFVEYQKEEWARPIFLVDTYRQPLNQYLDDLLLGFHWVDISRSDDPVDDAYQQAKQRMAIWFKDRMEHEAFKDFTRKI